MKNAKLCKAVKDVIQNEGDDREIAKIEEIASALLNEQGQEDIEELLMDRAFYGAAMYLATAVDDCLEKGLLADSRARAYYHLLGVNPADLEKFRQCSLKVNHENRASYLWDEIGEDFDSSDPMNFPRSRYH